MVENRGIDMESNLTCTRVEGATKNDGEQLNSSQQIGEVWNVILGESELSSRAGLLEGQLWECLKDCLLFDFQYLIVLIIRTRTRLTHLN